MDPFVFGVVLLAAFFHASWNALIKVGLLVAMAVIPGGLVLLAAWLYARVVSQRFHTLSGERRLQRAVAEVHLREVWNQARRGL